MYVFGPIPLPRERGTRVFQNDWVVRRWRNLRIQYDLEANDMRAKLMSSAAILLGVLTFATVASAQAHPDPNGTDDSYNSQSQNDIDIDTKIDVDDSFNTKTDNSIDASVNTKTEDSNNDNSDNSVNTKTDYDDSFNSDSSTNTKTDDSFNDNSDNSVNTKTEYDVDVDDSFNTKVDNDDSYNTKIENDDSYNTKIDDSYNTDNSTNTKVDDSYNTDNSVDNSVDIDDSFNTKVDDSYNTKVDDSYNTDNSTTTWNVHLSLTNQDLDATVSGQSFAAGGSDHHIGSLTTGNIGQDGGAFAGFAGIQTVSNNTGMGSIGQAATAVSANANVTFGNGGAH